MRPWRGSWLHRVDERGEEDVHLVDLAREVLVDQGLDRADHACRGAGRSPSCTTLATTLPPIRCRKPSPRAADGDVVGVDALRLPVLVRVQDQPQHVGVEAAAQALVGRDHDGARRASRVSRGTRKGWRYSVFALAMCSTMLNSFSMYGREARIRSWAFFIFEAATISIALVILRVLCTLLILFRISLEPAICRLLSRTGFARRDTA